MRGTQAHKRSSELYALFSGPTETVAGMRSNALAAHSTTEARSTPNYVDLSSPSASSVSSVSASSSASAWTFGSKRKQPPEHQTSITHVRNFGPAMTQAEADKIIIAEVKAILSRGEPPTRLLDDYVKASLMQRHPALWDYLPRDAETIYNRYIIQVDYNTTDELKTFIKKLPGRLNIAMDGATVNGKQKVNIFAFYILAFFSIQHTFTDKYFLQHHSLILFQDCIHSFKSRVLHLCHLVRPWEQKTSDGG